MHYHLVVSLTVLMNLDGSNEGCTRVRCMHRWVSCVCIHLPYVCMICVYCLKMCLQTVSFVEKFKYVVDLLCASFPGVSFNSVYTQIWRVLLHLAADPFPEVSDLAMKVLNSIAYKVCCV